MTLLPAGITTLATFDKSGIAPPAQLAGLDQSPPDVGPVHVTELNCVIFAVVDVVALTL